MTQTRRTNSQTRRTKPAARTTKKKQTQTRPSRAIQAKKNATKRTPVKKTAPKKTTSKKTSARRSTGRNTASKPRRRAKRGFIGGSREFVILASLVVGLSLLGITMVLSASSVVSLTTTGNPWGEFTSQAVWLVLGAGVCALATTIDYRLLRKLTIPALLASFALLVLVLVPSLGVSVNGAQRWLRLGPLQFQPSEVAKLALVLFAADNLARSKAVDLHRSVKPIIAVLIVFGALILLQPNLGTTIIFFSIGISALFASGVQLRFITAITSISAVGAALLAYFAPYRRDRLLAFIDPWQDPLDEGWQTIQSLVSVANGGVTGVGIGESRGKYGFLPEAHNDFVFAVTAEEFGLVGATIVVLAYVAFGITSLFVARKADRFGALLVIGVTTWILSQAFINIGAVLGLLPITGVPLPFMSAGGTSLVTTLAGVGLVLNVARKNR